MSVSLDSRVIRITRWLLDQSRPRSTADLAMDLGLSERVVRYRLGVAENYLESMGASLSRLRGSGLLVNADDALRQAIGVDLSERSGAPLVYSPEERERQLLASLLWAAPEIVSLDRLNEELHVSKTSARRDLHRCEPWLDRMGLPLVRKPGKGLLVMGTELSIRRALLQLFLEAVPGDVLDVLANTEVAEASAAARLPTGVRERFSGLAVVACSKAVRASSLRGALAEGNSELVFSLYLAISVARCLDDKPIALETGQLVSLIDHPASDGVRDLAESIADAGIARLSDGEIAGLTEYLLGLDALVRVQREEPELGELLEQILDVSGYRLHPSLAEDVELRRGLSLHLQRLAVRLRHGLPVHNPLLGEITARYPDVHKVSLDLGELISSHIGVDIGLDEVGFITMYLAGAMERGHLRQRRKALVVCPGGMATAWVLVSRIQAEFPELSIVEVKSASSYEQEHGADFDLVISTVPLESELAPVVVVNPLLPAADVRRVRALIGSN